MPWRESANFSKVHLSMCVLVFCKLTMPKSFVNSCAPRYYQFIVVACIIWHRSACHDILRKACAWISLSLYEKCIVAIPLIFSFLQLLESSFTLSLKHSFKQTACTVLKPRL